MTRSIDEFLGAHRAPRLTVRVTTRSDLLAEVTRLAAEYEALPTGVDAMNSDRDQLRSEMERLIREVRDSEFEFEFEALSKGAYDRVVATCPPTPSQAKDGFAWNPDTFPEMIIATCSVNPVITVAQAKELTEKLTDSQFRKLWSTAIAVNVGDDAAPKFVTPSALEAPGETSSGTPPSMASPDLSSLVES